MMIPDDILILVFKELDVFELNRLQLTCKQWRRLLTSTPCLWQSVRHLEKDAYRPTPDVLLRRLEALAAKNGKRFSELAMRVDIDCSDIEYDRTPDRLKRLLEALSSYQVDHLWIACDNTNTEHQRDYSDQENTAEDITEEYASTWNILRSVRVGRGDEEWFQPFCYWPNLSSSTTIERFATTCDGYLGGDWESEPDDGQPFSRLRSLEVSGYLEDTFALVLALLNAKETLQFLVMDLNNISDDLNFDIPAHAVPLSRLDTLDILLNSDCERLFSSFDITCQNVKRLTICGDSPITRRNRGSNNGGDLGSLVARFLTSATCELNIFKDAGRYTIHLLPQLINLRRIELWQYFEDANGQTDVGSVQLHPILEQLTASTQVPLRDVVVGTKYMDADTMERLVGLVKSRRENDHKSLLPIQSIEAYCLENKSTEEQERWLHRHVPVCTVTAFINTSAYHGEYEQRKSRQHDELCRRP